MNIATTQPLPALKPLEARVILDVPNQAGIERFIDLVQVDPRDSFGREDSFASLDDAMRAARELSREHASPIAVVSGVLDVNFGRDREDKPSYFLSQLRAERTGVVRGPWQSATPGTRIGADQVVAGVETRDLSEIRYVMWNEAIQAIVDGATEIRRDANWRVLPELDAGH